jgi:glycosyltransferase involved in cell wall biosynthesis
MVLAVARARPLVLHVSAVQYTAELLLLPQMEALRDHGYDVRVAFACEPGATPPRLAAFDPVDVRFPRSPRPIRAGRALARFLAALRVMRPDLVHLHSPAAALSIRCVPRTLLPAGTRVAYTVHGFPHQWDAPNLRERFLERAERLLAARTDLMLFQSQEDLERARSGGYRSRLVYLGNGVEDEWFDVPPRVCRRGPLRALFIGRLVQEKGLVELLDAVEQVPDVNLTLAGCQLSSDRDGAEAFVRERASSPGLAGRVRMLGSVSKSRLRDEMATTDVVVLPSHREGVPRSLIEGLASGRPAIATDIRGCRELVEHSRNGFLVPVRDAGALAAALRRMRNLTDLEYAGMSREARDRASASHRERLVIDRLVRAYVDLGLTT